METKICIDCKEQKPLSMYGTRKNHNKTNKIYIRSICNSCYVIRTRVWQNANRKRFDAYHKQYQKDHYAEKQARFQKRYKSDQEFREMMKDRWRKAGAKHRLKVKKKK